MVCTFEVATKSNQTSPPFIPSQEEGSVEGVAPKKETSVPCWLQLWSIFTGRVIEFEASSFLINAFGPDQ